MQPGLVSVVVPVYNGEAFVTQAVDSVLAQTYAPWELILVDDGSSDRSGELCQSLAERHPGVRCLRQENQGPAAARNTGLSLCRGEFVAFLDCDDAWLPQKLARQMPLFTDPAVGLVYSSLFLRQGDRLVDKTPSKVFHHGRCFAEILKYNFIPNSTVVVRRTLLEQAGPFDQRRELVGTEDKLMWLKIARLAEIACVREPLMIYNYQGQGVSSNQQAMLTGELLCLQEIAGLYPPATPPERSQLRAAYAAVYRHYAHNFFTLGDMRSARRCYGLSMAHGDWSPRNLLYSAASLLPAGLIRAARSLKAKAGQR